MILKRRKSMVAIMGLLMVAGILLTINATPIATGATLPYTPLVGGEAQLVSNGPTSGLLLVVTGLVLLAAALIVKRSAN